MQQLFSGKLMEDTHLVHHCIPNEGKSQLLIPGVEGWEGDGRTMRGSSEMLSM